MTANRGSVHIHSTHRHKDTNTVGMYLYWAPSANQVHLLDITGLKSGQGMLTDICALQQG